MSDQFEVTWVDHHRWPQCKPDPEFPDGKDLDFSFGDGVTCEVKLPYPAKRCGAYEVVCRTCGYRAVITTAGRPDDPRSLKITCPRPNTKKVH